jgi:hypothetical protein
VTPKEVLDELERAEREATPRPWNMMDLCVLSPAAKWEPKQSNNDLVALARNALPSLISDARTLAELLATLPKCGEKGCTALATYDFMRAIDTGDEYFCDQHIVQQKRESSGIGALPLDWAHIIRKLEKP